MFLVCVIGEIIVIYEEDIMVKIDCEYVIWVIKNYKYMIKLVVVC